MLTDDFKIRYVRYLGDRFDCPEHAQWAAFFNILDVDFEYKPLKFEFEMPGTEKYKPGRGVVRHYFTPTFILKGIGYVHVTDLPPLSYTLQCAERLSDKKDDPVYVIEGAPIVPRPQLATNVVTVCNGQTPPKHGYRLLHDGRRFRIGRPVVAADVYSQRIVEAALRAEMLGLVKQETRQAVT